MSSKEFKPATLGGKEYALKQLEERIQKYRGKDYTQLNVGLPAGAPVYYPCTRCNAPIGRGELHIDTAPKLCDECKALKACGWLENQALQIVFAAKKNGLQHVYQATLAEDGCILLVKKVPHVQKGPRVESEKFRFHGNRMILDDKDRCFTLFDDNNPVIQLNDVHALAVNVSEQGPKMD